MATGRRMKKEWWIRLEEGALVMGADEEILCWGLSACD